MIKSPVMTCHHFHVVGLYQGAGKTVLPELVREREESNENSAVKEGA